MAVPFPQAKWPCPLQELNFRPADTVGLHKPGANFIELLSRENCLPGIFA